MTRIEVALEEKEVFEVVESDVVGSDGELGDGDRRKVMKARRTIIEALGNTPLRMCQHLKNKPFQMYKLLTDRYAVDNVATRVQLQSRLSNNRYTGQSMVNFINELEDCFNRLASVGSIIEENMRVATLLASFGYKSGSPFGNIVTRIQMIGKEATWELTAATLTQEYENRESVYSEASRHQSHDGNRSNLALTARRFGTQFNGKSTKWRKSNRSSDMRKCFDCEEIGHIARYCPNKGRNSGMRRDDHAFPQQPRASYCHGVALGSLKPYGA